MAKLERRNQSFNRPSVKSNVEHSYLFYGFITAGIGKFICDFAFIRAGDVVCRVHGRLRGRGKPAAG
jgi:hypothetical protein